MRRRRISLWIGFIILPALLLPFGDAFAKETYKVRHGDTLYGIARDAGVTVRSLKAANHLRGNLIKADQILLIPGAKTKKTDRANHAAVSNENVYRVRKGDTLTAISRKTGVSIADLRDINHLDGKYLKIGLNLVLKRDPAGDAEKMAQESVITEKTPAAAAEDANVVRTKQALARIEENRIRSKALLGRWSSPDEPKLLVQAALGFLGTPYRLGGFSTKGIDCSGLVKKIYHFFDIELPRTAFEQSRIGMRVKRSELTVGDLLFFKTRRRIGHVGIYIGNNEFVHAASRNKGVCVDTLDTPYYKKRFIRAVRLKGKSDEP